MTFSSKVPNNLQEFLTFLAPLGVRHIVCNVYKCSTCASDVLGFLHMEKSKPLTRSVMQTVSRLPNQANHFILRHCTSCSLLLLVPCDTLTCMTFDLFAGKAGHR